METSRSQPSTASHGSFYTHETSLYHSDNPHFFLVSKSKPELQLRSVTLDDAPALLGLFTDQRNVKLDRSCDGLDNPEAIDNLIKAWSTFTDPLERMNCAIVIHGDVAGTGGLGWIGTGADGAKVGAAGVMLDSKWRRKGYAYEALRMTIDHGIRILGLDRVHIATREENDAFKQLMNVRFGFEAAPIEDKQFGNNWIWRITRDEWLKSQHCI